MYLGGPAFRDRAARRKNALQVEKYPSAEKIVEKLTIAAFIPSPYL
jgi:hypothetical protein